MSEWKKVKLGDYIDVLSGFAFKSKDFSDSGIPVIKIKNVSPPCISLEDLSFVPEPIAFQNSRYILKKGDILIAMTGSHINQIASVVGRVGRVRYDDITVLNQRVGKIINKNDDLSDIDFIYYYLSQYEVKVELAQKAGGAANQANISPSDIKNLLFPCPPIEVQHRIATILSRYDTLIENYQKQIKLLEEAAQRLYKEWFVDLRFPGYENVKMVDGLPEGWEKKTLGEVFSYVRGKSYSSSEISDEGCLMVNLKNIQAFGGYKRDAEKRFVGEYKSEQTLKKGDLVLGVTDMTQERRLVGHVALIPDFDEPVTFSMDLIKIVPYSIPTSFLYCAMRYGDISKQISPLANGVNVLHLKPEAMMGIVMTVPRKELVEKFCLVVEEMINKILKKPISNPPSHRGPRPLAAEADGRGDGSVTKMKWKYNENELLYEKERIARRL